jgi:hypothetical protein
MFARATVFMASIFLGRGLLELASRQAQEACTDENDDQDCLANVRVYGFKPSSLLTNIAIVAGIISAIILPLVGPLSIILPIDDMLVHGQPLV